MLVRREDVIVLIFDWISVMYNAVNDGTYVGMV